ncbi:MAG: tetratricopeptide repeat protein [Verrucomicrobiales bacterium]|nr:tetratricopeptide repeat protein [Verrucomicrobiales bacterium]
MSKSYATHPDALAVLGEVSLSRNNPAEAIRLLNNSLSIAPNNTETLEKLGNTYIAIGNLPAAETAFNKLLIKKPGLISAVISLATVHKRRGSHFSALDIYRKARQDFPDSIEIALSYSRFLADDEEYVAAIHEAQAALVLDGQNRDTLQVISEIYAMAGDQENAQIFEERARFAE